MHLIHAMFRAISGGPDRLFSGSVLWTLLWFASPCLAPGHPLITTHATTEMSGEGTAWAFADRGRGTIVVGTNQLLIREGERWTTVRVPGAYAFRGLAAALPGRPGALASRVYAGGIGDLGYIERDVTGDWRWHSLRAELDRAAPGIFEEVWQVKDTAEGVVFVTKHSVVRWQPFGAGESAGRFETWALPGEPRLLAMEIGDELWFEQPGVGLMRMGTGGPERVLRDAELPDSPAIWALRVRGGIVPSPAPSSKTDPFDGLLLGSGQGVWQRNGAAWTKLEPLSSRVAGKLPTGAVVLPDGSLAIGTFLSGVVHARSDGNVLGVIDQDSGLPDNAVHRVAMDAGGKLWVGLTRSFAEVEGLGTAEIFDEHAGIKGPVVRVIQNRQQRIVLGERAVLEATKNAAGERLIPLPGLDTFLWSGTALDGNLFIGGFGGIWRWDDSARTWSHEQIVSADVFALEPSRRERGWLYFAQNTRIMALESKVAALARNPAERGTGSVSGLTSATPWIPRDLDCNVGDTPTGLLEDADGFLWVATHQAGVLRFRLDLGPERPARLTLVETFRPGGNLPKEAGRFLLAQVGGRVCVLTDAARFSFDPALRQLVRRPELDDWNVAAVTQSVADGSADWLMSRPGQAQVISRVKWTADGSRLEFSPRDTPGLSRIGATGIFATSGDEGAELWITGTSGLLRYKADHLTAPPAPAGVRILNVITGGTEHRPLGDNQDGQPVSWPSGTRQVRLDYAPTGPGEGLRYASRLEPVESDWSPPQSAQNREFAALGSGQYLFRVRAVDAWGRSGAESRYTFEILPAWWATWPAYAADLLVLIALIAGLMRWRTQQLRRQNERLNRIIEERTRELELSNTAKSEFLENISHEIRNPLNGMVGLVGMLREAPLDPKARSLAGSLAACARALTRVFDDVLGFSKLEYGQVRLQVETFSPERLLEDIAEIFRATAEQKGSELRVRWDGSVPPALLGDDEKIRTIVSNFVSNALKYAPGFPVAITAQAEAGNPGTVDFTVNVTDHGEGIPAKEQGLIFKKFVRGTQAKAQGIPGTGLGLAACKALAELMGGFVGVESSAGQGATFYLRVTLATTEERVAAQPNGFQVAAPPCVAAVDERALVVEDDEYNQIVSVRIAEKLGFATDTAADTASALAQLSIRSYAVVLLDWELGPTKGGEVARAIRQKPGGSHPIIIATTAHDSDEIRRECRDSGMNGFVLKPLDAAQLSQIILETQAERRSRESPVNGEERLDPRVFSLVGENQADGTIAAARTWLETLDRHMATIRSELAAGSSDGAGRSAHRLRSHAGLIGAHTLRKAAATLQESLERKPTARDASAGLLGAVEGAAVEARRRVQVWLRDQAGAD